jgi:hypothetical protein
MHFFEWSESQNLSSGDFTRTRNDNNAFGGIIGGLDVASEDGMWNLSGT